MAVKHANTVGTADDGSSQTGSNEWNAEHNHVPFHYLISSDGGTAHAYVNLGAAIAEMAVPKSRALVDLTYANECRLIANQGVAGVTGKLAIQYSTDFTNWSYINATASGPVANFSTVANAVIASPWVTIDSGAKGQVWLRVIALGGNTTEDPSVWSVALQVK